MHQASIPHQKNTVVFVPTIIYTPPRLLPLLSFFYCAFFITTLYQQYMDCTLLLLVPHPLIDSQTFLCSASSVLRFLCCFLFFVCLFLSDDGGGLLWLVVLSLILIGVQNKEKQGALVEARAWKLSSRSRGVRQEVGAHPRALRDVTHGDPNTNPRAKILCENGSGATFSRGGTVLQYIHIHRSDICVAAGRKEEWTKCLMMEGGVLLAFFFFLERIV